MTSLTCGLGPPRTPNFCRLLAQHSWPYPNMAVSPVSLRQPPWVDDLRGRLEDPFAVLTVNGCRCFTCNQGIRAGGTNKRSEWVGIMEGFEDKVSYLGLKMPEDGWSPGEDVKIRQAYVHAKIPGWLRRSKNWQEMYMRYINCASKKCNIV